MRIEKEWLECDGFGGFACGTANIIPTRRYHALSVAALHAPSERRVLVHGIEAWVIIDGARFPISAFRYSPDVIHPNGIQHLADFSSEPFPCWHFRCGAIELQQELFIPRNSHRTVINWKLLSAGASKSSITLEVRPFISGRNYHHLIHASDQINTNFRQHYQEVIWQPLADGPAISATSNGAYQHAPQWNYHFHYTEEAARGFDSDEDLFSPGIFHFDLGKQRAALLLGLWTKEQEAPITSTGTLADALRRAERARREEQPLLDRSAECFVVQGEKGKTIVAGYPWFTDWGRDTFISLRGLCLSRGRFEEAGEILTRWAHAIDEGMIPNLFPDENAAPVYNSVDASLWFIVTAYELLSEKNWEPPAVLKNTLEEAIGEILYGYTRGTRFGIRMAHDGLLAAGEQGQQLTWMDARADGHEVTPRIGKPVEIQALWINANEIAARIGPEAIRAGCKQTVMRARTAFSARFWNANRRCLYDVIDVDHLPDAKDGSVRPNQIFAVGGLPFSALNDEAKQREVVRTVSELLYTPVGLRTLEPDDSRYRAHYQGGPRERDGAYHQGTAWPWLLGAYIEAWLKVAPDHSNARKEARKRFLTPLRQQLSEAGLGHLSEIYDGTSPQTPRGAPFQAWSLAEYLRISSLLGE